MDELAESVRNLAGSSRAEARAASRERDKDQEYQMGGACSIDGITMFLVVSLACSGFSYGFTRYGPWAQANPDKSYAGVPDAADQVSIVFFSFGLVWGLCLLLIGRFPDPQYRIANVTAVVTMLWSVAFFAGRFSPFNFATTWSLSTLNLPPGQNATIQACTYNNINYGVQDCNNLIGATAMMAMLWLHEAWYFSANWFHNLAFAAQRFLSQFNPLNWPIFFQQLFRLDDGTAPVYELYLIGTKESEAISGIGYVNRVRYAGHLLMFWLLVQTISQAAQYNAVNASSFYAVPQVVFSDLSLVGLLLAWVAWLCGVGWIVFRSYYDGIVFVLSGGPCRSGR